LPLAQRLDECLRQINDKHGALRGSIDKLVEHNEKTRNRTRGSQRYCDSSIEISQISYFANRVVNTRAIEGPGSGPAKLHTMLVYENGITWKTIVPLQFLLKGWGDANSGHQCYIHTIAHKLEQIDSLEKWQARRQADSDEYYYVGITGRNWLLRFSEHMGELRRGSRKKFHAAWRDSLGLRDVHFISSLMDINLTYEDAMNWEELHVDRVAYGPNGLNMIPGGFRGQRELHKLGLIGRLGIALEERDKALAEYVRRNPRRGIPNPFVAELWKDDEFYLKNIGARAKTLSPDQVRKIRKLCANGRSVAEITEEVGALNETQVKNLIAGKTYRRIR